MNDNPVAGVYAEHVMAADADEPFTPQNHPTAGRPTPRRLRPVGR